MLASSLYLRHLVQTRTEYFVKRCVGVKFFRGSHHRTTQTHAVPAVIFALSSCMAGLCWSICGADTGVTKRRAPNRASSCRYRPFKQHEASAALHLTASPVCVSPYLCFSPLCLKVPKNIHKSRKKMIEYNRPCRHFQHFPSTATLTTFIIA